MRCEAALAVALASVLPAGQAEAQAERSALVYELSGQVTYRQADARPRPVGLGQTLSPDARIRLPRGATIRLLIGSELVLVRGPQDVQVDAVAGPVKVADNERRELLGGMRMAMAAIEGLPVIRGSSSARDPWAMNLRLSGTVCLPDDTPPIIQAEGRAGDDLEVRDASNGARGAAVYDPNAAAWRWPPALVVSDGGAYDLVQEQPPLRLRWLLRIRPDSARAPAETLTWLVRTGCGRQAVVFMSTFEPDRVVEPN